MPGTVIKHILVCREKPNHPKSKSDFLKTSDFRVHHMMFRTREPFPCRVQLNVRDFHFFGYRCPAETQSSISPVCYPVTGLHQNLLQNVTVYRCSCSKPVSEYVSEKQVLFHFCAKGQLQGITRILFTAEIYWNPFVTCQKRVSLPVNLLYAVFKARKGTFCIPIKMKVC